MGKPKKWRRYRSLTYTSSGCLNRNSYPRKNKLIHTDATADEKRSPAADADKRQG